MTSRTSGAITPLSDVQQLRRRLRALEFCIDLTAWADNAAATARHATALQAARKQLGRLMA